MDNRGAGHNEQTGNAVPDINFDAQLPTPNQIPATPEKNPEKTEVTTEQTPNLPPPVPPVTIASDNDDDDTSTQQTVVPTGTIEEQNPEIAVDGDKMEKEWVAKTEKVINATKHDPQREEIETNKLKADYMAKRFNRHLGDRNN